MTKTKKPEKTVRFFAGGRVKPETKERYYRHYDAYRGDRRRVTLDEFLNHMMDKAGMK